MTRIVVALGGNAILQPGQKGYMEEQEANILKTCIGIADLIEMGYEVIITHGNGPQVGNILLQNEAAKDLVPPMPLDVCGAKSQGMIGYMLQRLLRNVLSSRGIEKQIVTLLTQVVVSSDDEAFKNPTKPIGPYYSLEEKVCHEDKGYVLKEIPRRGWRRVVPSPDPLGIVERDTICNLLETGTIVIASGGGGIPVANVNGVLKGLEAVIDKDLAGERLAREVNADILMILTDVDAVYLRYGNEDSEKLQELTVQQAKLYLAQGEFPPGSMGPKVQAAIRFVENGGKKAIITHLDQAPAALKGKAGTLLKKT